MNNETTPLTRWRNWKQIVDVYQQHRSESVLCRRFRLSPDEALAIANTVTEMEKNNNDDAE